jgi:hypothetical protein
MVRGILILTMIAAPMAAQQATLKIVNVGDAMDVRQQGRVIGRTPNTFSLTAGTHRLTVGQNEVCVVLPAGVSGEMILVGGAIEDVKGAVRCEDAWSEIAIAPLPAGIDVSAEPALIQTTRDGLTLRAPLPGLYRLRFSGTRYASFETEVQVGLRERSRYTLRLGPARPALLSDTILQSVPAEPTPPRPPVYPVAPRDPSGAYADASNRLAIIRSRQPADGIGTVAALAFLGAAATAVVFNTKYIKDTITPDLALRRNRDIAVGIAGGSAVIVLWTNSIVRGKVSRAACVDNAAPCERRLRAEAEELGREVLTLPERRARWSQAKAGQDSAYAAAQTLHAVERQNWLRRVAEVERRNATATSNRLTNQRLISAWLERARAAQALTLVSRGTRP